MATLPSCGRFWWSTRRPRPRSPATREVLAQRARERAQARGGHTDAPRPRRRAGRQAAARTASTLVVALGGDGTVNEVVNGLLHGRARPSDLPASPSSPAAAPTSSPARSGCPATRSRRPAPCSTRCATAPAPRDRPRPGRTSAGSPSTPGWAATPRWSARVDQRRGERGQHVHARRSTCGRLCASFPA